MMHKALGVIIQQKSTAKPAAKTVVPAKAAMPAAPAVPAKAVAPAAKPAAVTTLAPAPIAKTTASAPITKSAPAPAAPVPAAQDKTSAPAAKGSRLFVVYVVVALCAGVAAAYLSWTSNTLLDKALTAVAPGSATGRMMNTAYALHAFVNGVSYLAYYSIFKAKRMCAVAAKFA